MGKQCKRCRLSALCLPLGIDRFAERHWRCGHCNGIFYDTGVAFLVVGDEYARCQPLYEYCSEFVAILGNLEKMNFQYKRCFKCFRIDEDRRRQVLQELERGHGEKEMLSL